MNLPQQFQVIYDEAIRGKHILFPSAVIPELQCRCPKETSLAHIEAVEVITDLIKCPDIPTMINLIKKLSVDVMRVIFHTYLHFVDSWSYKLKTEILN